MAKSSKLPTFQRINVPSVIWHLNAAETPKDLPALVLSCIESLDDGTKLSFQYNEQRKGFNCSITQSCVGNVEERETVSLWGGSLEEALEQAYFLLAIYDCQGLGFVACQESIKKHEKHAVAAMMEALQNK